MFCLLSTVILAIAGVCLYNLLNRLYRRRFVSGFRSKYVLITGCGNGFGHKLAVDLDSRGLNVYAGCRTQNSADNLKKMTSNRLKTIVLDVTNQHSVDEAVRFIEADLPSGKYLWGLVNNAGILGNLSFELADLEDYRQVMEVNFFGPIRVTKAFAPLIKQSRGRIVQVNSMFGRGTTNAAPYTCSKHASEPFADELRRYMRPFGVQVATIEPGVFTSTGLGEENAWVNVLKRRWASMSNDEKDKLGHDYLDNEIQFFRQVLLNSPVGDWNDPGMVTEAMTHALGAKHPKARYVVGYDARPFIIITNYTPDWFLDGLIMFIRRAARNKSKKLSRSE